MWVSSVEVEDDGGATLTFERGEGATVELRARLYPDGRLVDADDLQVFCATLERDLLRCWVAYLLETEVLDFFANP